LRTQLGAHRGINIGVTAGDFVTGFFCQYGKATHEGAADAKYVDMHCKIRVWNPVDFTRPAPAANADCSGVLQ
jgi:hypothetical protein